MFNYYQAFYGNQTSGETTAADSGEETTAAAEDSTEETTAAVEDSTEETTAEEAATEAE